MERFHPSRFLSTGKAQKDRNVNHHFTCWTLTGVATNRFCDIHLLRNKLQSQIRWCKPGQTPEVWKSLHLHQNKWKLQCPLAETPSPLFLCCTCGSAPQCPGTISAHWRRSRWLLHPGETSHNLSHIRILPLFYPRKTQPAPSALFPAPVPARGGLMEPRVQLSSTWQPIGQGPVRPGRGKAGDGQGTGPGKPLGLLLPLEVMNQGELEVLFQRLGVLMWQSPAGPSSASCAGRTLSSSAPAPVASSAAVPPPHAPVLCWPWHQPGRALWPGSECPARKGMGLETRQRPAPALRETADLGRNCT